MEERVAQLEKELRELKELYLKDNFESRQIFRKRVEFLGGFNLSNQTLSTGGSPGLTIGEASDKVAFFGEAPVGQQASISAPTGGTTTDAEARSAINSILSVLDAFGFTA